MRSRWLVAAALLAAAGGLFWAWPLVRPAFSGGVKSASDLLATAEGWGPLVVVALQTLQAVISPLPSWPVTVAAGASYGPLLGTLYSLIGGMLGAAVNFAIARRLGQPWLRRKVGEKWLLRASRLAPWHFLLLSLLGRLIPVASFDAVAYLAGISRISMAVFLGVALLGQLPAFLAYAIFGSDLAKAESAGLLGTLLFLLFGGLILGGRRLWEKLFREGP